jgi:DNA transformation protein and related proteins
MRSCSKLLSIPAAQNSSIFTESLAEKSNNCATGIYSPRYHLPMSASPAFARIERDTLRLAALIPHGRVCTFAELGSAIDVPARHVAYIVSRLDAAARKTVPVHRLVGEAGALQKKVAAEQAAALETEGISTANACVQNFAALAFTFTKATVNTAKVERTTRPPEHRRSPSGAPALSELPGLGPVSIEWLKAAGIKDAGALRKADAFALFAKIKATRARVSVNLLYALLGAQENVDWRTIARERRTEILMRLDDAGLL